MTFTLNNESKKNTKTNKTKNNCLLIILLLITSSIIFVCLFFTKIYNINKNNNINKFIKDEITCNNGLFLPDDDKTKCIKCSIENCNECTGRKMNNTCNKCNPGFNPFYEDNKIISCSICNEGYYPFKDECKAYSFRAKYKPNGGIIKLINSEVNKIKEIFVDKNQVSPSNYYSFNDTQEHEILMLLDMPKYLNSLNSMFNGIKSMISIEFSSFFNTSNITDMYAMFYNCYSLTSINLSNFDTSKVNYMTGMFGYCSSLTSINLSTFDTSNVNYMSFMIKDFKASYSRPVQDAS